MNLADEIEKLSELHRSGALSDEEYRQAKETLLAEKPPFKPLVVLNPDSWGVLIHLSQFMTYLLPLAGIIAPIILWQIKKNESEIINRHGIVVMNWLLTEILLLLVAIPLCIILIGFPLVFLITLAGILFPIIGAIKAGNGEIWPYPGSIRFFK